MGLVKSKGNMYDFVSHTWNAIKGVCPHDCSYCYVKRWGKQPDLYLDERELKTNLGSGNFIFVGSGCDMWADGINPGWIIRVVEHCHKFPNNKYLFQTKNPSMFVWGAFMLNRETDVLCTTIESNITYSAFMGNTPSPINRAVAMNFMFSMGFETYVTIEPIMDFDTYELADIINTCCPSQVNIGADSGRNELPEPDREKVLGLIDRLSKFTTIHRKTNLKRILQ